MGSTRTLTWNGLPRDLLHGSGCRESSGLADGWSAKNAKLGNSRWSQGGHLLQVYLLLLGKHRTQSKGLLKGGLLKDLVLFRLPELKLIRAIILKSSVESSWNFLSHSKLSTQSDVLSGSSSLTPSAWSVSQQHSGTSPSACSKSPHFCSLSRLVFMCLWRGAFQHGILHLAKLQL